MRVADYIAKFLADHGVRDVFVLTGHGAMYMNDGIAKEPRLKYCCARNEATAPMMAESYARITNTAAAVCVTSGPGSTNAVPGLAEAWVDGAPIIILSGQVPRAHSTRFLGLGGLRSFGNAEIDIIPIVKALTKYAAFVDDPKKIRYHLEQALYLATSGHPGPVWIDVPIDVQSAEIDPEHLESFTPPQTKSAYPTESEMKQIIAMLEKAKRPVIVGGQGIRIAQAVNDFKILLEKIGAPVFLSRLGLDILPFSHPLNMGIAGIKGSRYCLEIAKKADAALVIGSRLAVPFTGYKFDIFQNNIPVAVVDIEEAELKKPGIPITLAIKSDAKHFIQTLCKNLESHPLPSYEEWVKICAHYKKEKPIVTKDFERNPIDLYYFMSRLDAVSNENHIFITDAGSNYYVGGQVFRFEHGQREVTSGTFAAMGLTLPLAVGASIAAPEKQILAVTGDGSLELNVQELKTISYYNFNIKLFVINNGGYVSMRNWQDTYFEGRHIGSDDKTGIEVLDLKKVAEAFDLRHTVIADWQEVDNRLKEIVKEPGPIFVEVICDNNQKIIEPTN